MVDAFTFAALVIVAIAGCVGSYWRGYTTGASETRKLYDDQAFYPEDWTAAVKFGDEG